MEYEGIESPSDVPALVFTLYSSRLAIALGEQVGVALPVATSADNAMKAAMPANADLDFSSTFEAQKKK